MNWDELKSIALAKVSEFSDLHQKRLAFEIKEIEKQGTITYWIRQYEKGTRWSTNPDALLFPYTLGMVEHDPVVGREHVPLSTSYDYVQEWIKTHGSLPNDIYRDADSPDIDIDCLPDSRDPLKEYVIKTYGGDMSDGIGQVCSVGTYMTYKFKSALADAAVGLGTCLKETVLKLTDTLPEDVDGLPEGGASTCVGKILDVETNVERECRFKHASAKCPKCGCTETEDPTIEQLLNEYTELRDFAISYPDVLQESLKLIGKIQHMSKHAGALIIADRPLYGNIPMFKKDGHWISMWTEGRKPQLSKFGYTKWDILGLKNLEYIYETCKMIEENYGISFGEALSGLTEINPLENRAGCYFKDGKKYDIPFDDQAALKLANDSKTDGVFQFDTPLAKSILANGVKSFDDLMVLGAMGHPGPMACIPEYIARRDDPHESWRALEHETITKILETTKNVIVYQEQLADIWMAVGGFTAPEAQAARKSVAKKWKDKLKPIEEKWLLGAQPVIGLQAAIDWWAKMASFARYCFNKSHGVSYYWVAYINLWLKAHYRSELWATILSFCDDSKKFIRYMNVARAEGVKFGPMDVTDLKVNFNAKNNVVSPGLIGIKGIGENSAKEFQGSWRGTDIDQFIEVKPKSKSVLERLIKLGAFTSLHPNIKATWLWYQFKYCSGTDITQLRKMVRAKLLESENWTQEKIESERRRQAMEYRKLYPKRNKIPDKIMNWMPKPAETREAVMALLSTDYDVAELLTFEKDYLGYYIHSPLDVFEHNGGLSIESAKAEAAESGVSLIEGVITSVGMSKTKKETLMCRLIVNDGYEDALLILWEGDIRMHSESMLVHGTGIQACVKYDEKRNNFTLARGTTMMRLQRKMMAAVPIEAELALECAQA